MIKKMVFCSVAIIITAVAMPSRGEGLTLEQVIREVSINSDSVKMMHETLKKVDQMVREKWANALPVVSLTGAYVHSYGSALGGSSSSGSSSRSLGKEAATHPSDSATVTYGGLHNYMTVHDSIAAAQAAAQSKAMFDPLSKPANSDIYTGAISFNQPIYTFGKVGTAIDVAKCYSKSAKASYVRNMQTLQLGALDMFFFTMMAEKRAEISVRTLARKKELFAFLDRNFQNGAGNKAQVLKTKADLADQIAQVMVAKRDAKVARMNLNAMMGRSLTDSIRLDTVVFLGGLVNSQSPKADEAVSTALSERTDLKSIKFLAESNKGGAKIFKAMYLPSIAATGSAGYSKMQSEVSMLSTNGNPNWTLGVAAQWTLFDGFANSAKAAQYESDANKLEIVASTMAKMVEIEVRSALLECDAADSNLISSREMYNSAQEGYELINSNFKQGSGQFSDLQLSDETLQQAELGMMNAKYRLVKSRAALNVAMGREIVKIK